MSDTSFTPIFDEIDKEYQTRTGVFTPEDPLDTTIPLPAGDDDPVIGNAEPS